MFVKELYKQHDIDNCIKITQVELPFCGHPLEHDGGFIEVLLQGPSGSRPAHHGHPAQAQGELGKFLAAVD